MITEEFLNRRHSLLAKMAPASAALFFSAPQARRNADCTWPYRQDSHFWYFTGFNEPQALLVIIKQPNGKPHSLLFNRVRDKQAETWNGRRLGQQAAPATLKIDEALPYEDIASQLAKRLNGLHIVYHSQGLYPHADEIVFNALETLRGGARKNWRAPASLIDWRPWVHEMRLIKSPAEIALLRKAGEISALAHRRAMCQCRPGLFEYHLEAEILHEFQRHGARFPAYNTIVGGGENGCILHYVENQSPLRDGDLVLIDAGCEYQSYAGDITRTFPVNGKFTPPQRAIYNIVLDAMTTALRLYAPGTSIDEVNKAVLRVMVNGLVKLGILHGDTETLLAARAWEPFFMHGLSHWLGLDVHDVGDYQPERSRPLQPGMVLTVEPGLYFAPDADVPADYRGTGIRIEDDIVITEQGNDNLTASVVKHPDDIEALMAKARIA